MKRPIHTRQRVLSCDAAAVCMNAQAESARVVVVARHCCCHGGAAAATEKQQAEVVHWQSLLPPPLLLLLLLLLFPLCGGHTQQRYLYRYQQA